MRVKSGNCDDKDCFICKTGGYHIGMIEHIVWFVVVLVLINLPTGV